MVDRKTRPRNEHDSDMRGRGCTGATTTLGWGQLETMTHVRGVGCTCPSGVEMIEDEFDRQSLRRTWKIYGKARERLVARVMREC